MDRKVVYVFFFQTFGAIVSLCEEQEPATIEKAEKIFKDSRTQGLYYRNISSDESLDSAAKKVFLNDFLTPRHLRKPKNYFKDWKTIFTDEDVPTGLEHDKTAILRELKQPADITAFLYMNQLLNRNGDQKKAENAFKNVFANGRNNRYGEYTLGDGKDVHGILVAAETEKAKPNKSGKAAYLMFMESTKSLEKEYKETTQTRQEKVGIKQHLE